MILIFLAVILIFDLDQKTYDLLQLWRQRQTFKYAYGQWVLTQPSSVHLLTGNGATLKNSADMCRFSFLCLVSLVAKLILCLCREMKTQDVVYQQP